MKASDQSAAEPPPDRPSFAVDAPDFGPSAMGVDADRSDLALSDLAPSDLALSVVLADGLDASGVAPSVAPLADGDESPPDAPSAADEREAREAMEACRSFLAQPEPLKWIVGGEKAFFTGPRPHNAHAVGPSSWTPRTTSKRRPHAAQS